MLDLTNKAEEAIKATLDAATVAATVFAGQSAETIELPACIVHAQAGQEAPLNSGNCYVSVEVRVMSNADDTAIADHRSLCTSIFTVLMADDLATTLSAAASDFSVLGIRNRSVREDRQDDSWVSTLSFELYCCRADLG